MTLKTGEAVPGEGGNLVECDAFRRGIGLLLEPLQTDRSQRRDDRRFSALSCHFLRSAAECPSELGEPDGRERYSADHCTPHRWFHSGMDLHFVTLVCEKRNSLVSGQSANIGRGERAKIDSETTQTTLARLNCRISATVPA